MYFKNVPRGVFRGIWDFHVRGHPETFRNVPFRRFSASTAHFPRLSGKFSPHLALRHADSAAGSAAGWQQ